MCTALAENLSLILNSHIKQLASLGAKLGYTQLRDRDRETETGEELKTNISKMLFYNYSSVIPFTLFQSLWFPWCALRLPGNHVCSLSRHNNSSSAPSRFNSTCYLLRIPSISTFHKIATHCLDVLYSWPQFLFGIIICFILYTLHLLNFPRCTFWQSVIFLCVVYLHSQN